MNLENLFDDLESRFEQLQPPRIALRNLTPIGFVNVTFGKGHFVGIVAGTTVWRLTRFNHLASIPLEVGTSLVDNSSASRRYASLVQRWVRVSTGDQNFAGRLEAIDSGLLLFRNTAIPIASVKTLEVHAVEN